MAIITPTTVIHHTDFYWSISGLSNQLDWFVLYTDSDNHTYWRSIKNASEDLIVTGKILTIGRLYCYNNLFFFLVTSISIIELGYHPDNSHSVIISPLIHSVKDATLQENSVVENIGEWLDYNPLGIYKLIIYDLNYNILFTGAGFHPSNILTTAIDTYFHRETDPNTSITGTVWDKIWRITKGNNTSMLSGTFFPYMENDYYIKNPSFSDIVCPSSSSGEASSM
jgi:hypothetical protein